MLTPDPVLLGRLRCFLEGADDAAIHLDFPTYSLYLIAIRTLIDEAIEDAQPGELAENPTPNKASVITASQQ